MDWRGKEYMSSVDISCGTIYMVKECTSNICIDSDNIAVILSSQCRKNIKAGACLLYTSLAELAEEMSQAV